MEVERARVTRLLAQILENESPPKISEAATTLCELQIETYGSMYVIIWEILMIGRVLRRRILYLSNSDFVSLQMTGIPRRIFLAK